MLSEYNTIPSLFKHFFIFHCAFHPFFMTFHDRLFAPGRLVFLTSGVHIADTCTEISGSGELHRN